MDFSIRHVVVTGGEPMLFAELVPLCHQLAQNACHITIETAGTLFLPLQCDLMSISPKLSNSSPSPVSHPKWHQRHERTRHAPDVIRRLVAEHLYQIKFVVTAPTDCDEVLSYLDEFREIDRDRVLLMPEGVSQSRLREFDGWLPEYCVRHQFRYCPRRHIEWFGNRRGT
jgi:7-carboxy-7-deazaguanine synthase